MNLKPRINEEPDLNLTSLIDVVLLLLIFFMVSTTFVDESRIKLQLPQASNADAPEQQKREPIEITVAVSGEYRVNGKTLLNTSPATLSAAVSKLAGEARDYPITIRADARATHQAVVTAMDVVGRLGFRAINIATINETSNPGPAR
jgi:biopolymer transport protein ExbD